MTPEQKRKFNTTFGALFLAMGVVGWGLTVYYAMTPNPPRPTPVQNAPTLDIGSCKSALETLGYTVTQAGASVSFYEPLSDDPRGQMYQASMAIHLCKMKLSTFCMGEACEQPGVSVTMTLPAAAGQKSAVQVQPKSVPPPPPPSK
jgi:hypothetical protein